MDGKSRCWAMVLFVAGVAPLAIAGDRERWWTVYVQQAFPRQEATNEQIEQINDLLGTDFDTWDDVVNVSIGSQLFWRVSPRFLVGVELDLGRGGIDQTQTRNGLRVDFEQIYQIYANALVASHLVLCDCGKAKPFVLAAAGVGYEKDTTKLRVRGGGLDERLLVENDGAFPVATVGVGADLFILPRDFYLEVGVAYYWGRLRHHVPAEGSLAPSPYVLADNDSTGPNYWIGVGRRF